MIFSSVSNREKENRIRLNIGSEPLGRKRTGPDSKLEVPKFMITNEYIKKNKEL